MLETNIRGRNRVPNHRDSLEVRRETREKKNEGGGELLDCPDCFFPAVKNCNAGIPIQSEGRPQPRHTCVVLGQRGGNKCESNKLGKGSDILWDLYCIRTQTPNVDGGYRMLRRLPKKTMRARASYELFIFLFHFRIL